MTASRIELATELLNVMQEIQTNVTYILDKYIVCACECECDGMDCVTMHDINLLTANIIKMRDMTQFMRATVEYLADDYENSATGTGTECALAFTLMLHLHMLTDPESIYNSGIICGDNWEDNELDKGLDLDIITNKNS